MRISKFIKSICKQTAVYWGEPVPDGMGGYIFSPGEEIICRWDDKIEVIRNKKGIEIVCKAEILVPEDLTEGGYLYLGSLDDLDSAQVDNPLLVDNAYEIQRINKTSMIKSTTEFVRQVYL